jgi:hypothetical protein
MEKAAAAAAAASCYALHIDVAQQPVTAGINHLLHLQGWRKQQQQQQQQPVAMHCTLT